MILIHCLCALFVLQTQLTAQLSYMVKYRSTPGASTFMHGVLLSFKRNVIFHTSSYVLT